MFDLEKIEKDDNWAKRVFEEQKQKHNVVLKIFDFTQPDFDEKFKEYKDWLHRCFYNEDTKLSDNSWVSNVYADELIEDYTMLQHQYPDFLKEFLFEFVKTKFFQKYYDEYRKFYPYLEEYCLANWSINSLDCYTDRDCITKIFSGWVEFGEIPHYAGDKLCAIRLNFSKKKAEVVRGYAVGLYSSRILKTYRPVPKYMQPIVDKVFSDFDEWNKTHKII